MTLEVRGLRELNRALRKVDPSLGKRTQVALKAISTEAAERAQARARSQFGAIGSKGAKGIRPRAKQSKATVALLGSNPVIRGLEFGAIVHPVFGRSRVQSSFKNRVFPPWVGNQSTGARANFGQGYVVAPTMNEMLEEEDVKERLARALDEALDLSGV